MGIPFNYDPFAPIYQKTRTAVKWVLDPLNALVKDLPVQSNILEIGCGTGNYIIELSGTFPDHKYSGFDISDEMLRIAKNRSNKINFEKVDAEKNFPNKGIIFDFCFAVDVIHHIVNIQNFFTETYKCLKQNCLFALVTDLEKNIRGRSLSKYFPEILKVELERYPSFDLIKSSAFNAGFSLSEIIPAEGYRGIDDDFIDKVKSKCSSSMRLITDEEHNRGVERLNKAKSSGEKWFSTYSILVFNK